MGKIAIILIANLALMMFVAAWKMFVAAWNSSPQNKNLDATASKDSITDAADSQTHSKIKIRFPQGDEKFIRGKTYTLKWTGGDSTLTIFLVDSSLQSIGVSVSLSDRKYHVENTGTFEYTFPDRLEEGAYKFEIGTAFSKYFQVVSK